MPEKKELPDAELYPDALNLVYDYSGISRWRWGFRPYDADGGAHTITYGKETMTVTQSGCFKNYLDGQSASVEGIRRRYYDNIGSQFCTEEERLNFSTYHYWQGRLDPMIGPTSKSYTYEYLVREEDGRWVKIGSQTHTYLLSEPISNNDFREICANLIPPYRSNYPYRQYISGYSSAPITVASQYGGHYSNDSYRYYNAEQRRLKFIWGENVSEEDKYPVEYFAFFQPVDDDLTKDIDESTNMRFIRRVYWDGKGREYKVPDFTVASDIDIDENGRVMLLKVKLESISFSGSKYHELKSDNALTVYSAPHWVDANGDGDTDDLGDKHYPVAYTRKTKPKIGAVFNMGAYLGGVPVKVRAIGPGGIAIPETSLTVSSRRVTLPATESTGAFVNTIKHYDHETSGKEFELAWEMQIGSSGWFSVGKTKHTLYLTLADPVTPLRQETLFYLSCKNADGDSAEGVARDSMYAEFTDRDVRRLDGVQMTYWVNDAMGCTDTPELLVRQDGNGNCQSWGGFFRDILRVHGINADRIRVWPKSTDSSVIVKNWQFNEPPSGAPQHPYIEGLDAFDLAGIPGQGNPNPPGAFNGHWITKSGGSYYDPSYGTPVVSGSDADKQYEDGAFDGFGELYQTSGGSVVRGIRKNETGAGGSEVDYSLAN